MRPIASFTSSPSSEIRVDQFARFGVVRLFLDVAALDDRNDLQPEMAGEGVVARVVGRNGHDGPRAVASQHVVRNVDRNRLARERVDRVGACRNAAYALGFGDALALGAFLRLGDVLLDGGLCCSGVVRSPNPLVLRGDDHEGHAEDRVGTRGEYLEFFGRSPGCRRRPARLPNGRSSCAGSPSASRSTRACSSPSSIRWA